MFTLYFVFGSFISFVSSQWLALFLFFYILTFRSSSVLRGVFYRPDWIMFISFHYILLNQRWISPLKMYFKNQTNRLDRHSYSIRRWNACNCTESTFVLHPGISKSHAVCDVTKQIDELWPMMAQRNKHKKCNVLCHHVHSHLQFRLSRLQSVLVVVVFIQQYNIIFHWTMFKTNKSPEFILKTFSFFLCIRRIIRPSLSLFRIEFVDGKDVACLADAR